MTILVCQIIGPAAAGSAGPVSTPVYFYAFTRRIFCSFTAIYFTKKGTANKPTRLTRQAIFDR